VEGSCEHGNEPSGSIKCWAASQEGLSSIKLTLSTFSSPPFFILFISLYHFFLYPLFIIYFNLAI
jgi:hypothetical protein